MHKHAIAAVDLTVVRERKTVLDGMNFSIQAGKITGLIGPSGSGKTTLMRAIVGVQKLTSGELLVLELPAGHKALRSKIGYMAQTASVYEDLTVLQNLRYFGAIVGASKSAIQTTLKLVDLEAQANQVVNTLSGGQRARVSLAVALLGDPQLLVLDEPTVGLDPVLRRDLWKLFHRLADGGKTLLISSHVMDEAEQCAAILLMRDGRVLSHDDKQDLLKRTHTKSVEAAFLKLVEGVEHA